MESVQSEPVSTENVLDEVEYTLAQANGWRRFFNWVIDRIAIYLVWRFLLFKINLVILTEIYRYSESTTVVYIFTYIMYVTFFILVQSSLETLMHGKTLGKWMTGTRAINQDGTPVNGRTAFLRGLSRLVPFEPFSALGSPCFPWHDRWTNTYVIDERESSFLA